ncbi:hypothetical protein QH494_22690 [Sphingomonas sp. AR_OL41]|uniref:hypothetical protein n=1 Tax=Sphingomonas sp. AR_OL41 TaxID=3042729 RepID=UPI00247FA1B6|nr:hypothetical protein [Sphingomonas sp. AR_OL41]MDH7975001.1 hypothetical protein [Sphingomonas sp. AR_OL41]
MKKASAFLGRQAKLSSIFFWPIAPMNCLEIRAVATCFVNAWGGAGLPTMVLSSRADEAARLCALEAGAVDCVQIPISTRELATRVLRILSRTSPDLFDRPLAYGDIAMDVAAEKVFRDGKFFAPDPRAIVCLTATRRAIR